MEKLVQNYSVLFSFFPSFQGYIYTIQNTVEVGRWIDAGGKLRCRGTHLKRVTEKREKEELHQKPVNTH